ncbi:MAG TPA: Uma2 family endonuclease [Pyrinomonadaceae bacterium]|nr:Uma2 family endonuclease [Pyrinomonadaceae bacterium]
MSAEELLAMPDDGFRYELVEGELRQMSPAGHNHGRIAMRLAVPLGKFVADNNLGEVYAAETGFKLRTNPDTVRAPDVSFIRLERVEEVGETEGFWPGAPDLVVEVNSPGDTIGEVEEKVRDWLSAGTKLVWVISPKLRVVTVYRSLDDIITLAEKDMLDGGEVVPGFQLLVAGLFAR